ncbi:MAG: DegT/DnrJ/EryC1/StrS family aminotransferase [Myxococcales bacterium]|nr:DegT/DnrJ/EryC1/StrS family aminotransferase [Myxococcales bacterium]
MQPPCSDFVALSPPSLGEKELEAIGLVLASGRLVQGPWVERFEARMAERCRRKFAVAVSSGTSALELALEALGIQNGDEVLCPALTWPSPANAVALRGASPVLVDVDPEDWNLDPKLVTQARSSRTRAAIVIDQFGMPARWQKLNPLLEGLHIIEDAACAIGSSSPEGPCGSFGIISTLSFHPRKVLTTAEGGMCLTDDANIADRLRILRNHGQEKPGSFVCAAGNHRMSEVAAAMGLAQLDRLDDIVALRQMLAQRYRDALPELSWQKVPQGASSNMQTMGATVARDRDGLIEGLRERRIEAGRLSYNLAELTSLRACCRVPEPPSHTADIVSRGLALPLHPALDIATQDHVIDSIRELL